MSSNDGGGDAQAGSQEVCWDEMQDEQQGKL